MRNLAITLIIILFAMPAAAQDSESQTIIIRENPGMTFGDNRHNDAYAWDVIEELTGERPPQSASREELAARVLTVLGDRLPQYGLKSTPQVRPEIPEWFLDGYSTLQPASVSRSRWLNGVIDGLEEADADIAALYAIWCVYDAEWFSLSRRADHKAWLSALMLSYAPQWMDLTGYSRDELHELYVVPLMTPDEPYREIDNWIKRCANADGAFSKPTVRNALVMELLDRAGAESDDRFYEDEAYSGPAPEHLGLSSREFFLLAALTLEFFQEMYGLDHETKQPLHFRDYFVGVFYAEAEDV